MKLIKSIVVMIVVLATTLAHAGDSVPFRLDTVTISTSPVVDSLSISWDASWIGGNANATVVIADNGVEVKRTMGSGEFTYTFPGGGRHELTYTTYIGSVAQEDVYTTTFYFPNVFFDATGGNVDEQFRCVNPGGTIGILPTPTRIGYTFAGWWTTASGGTQISDSTIITDYVTNHAHWTINQYTVTFDANGGTGGTSVTQDYDTPIVVPVVTNEGVGDWWFFAYWSPAVAATVPASNVTYTAQWRRWCDSISASKMGNKTMKQLYPADYTYMTTVILEEGIKELPEGFFNGCTALENLTIPLSLEEFGYDDLPPRIKERLEYDANGFKIFGNWVLDYQDRSASAVTIPNGIVGIGRGAFEEMFDLETVKFPEESLTAIARGAFKDCSWMQEVAFPSSLRHVGQQAFKDCTSLLRATFADGLLYIGASAFSGCWQMQSVRIPYTVTSIGSGAFSGCGNIRGVTVPTHLMTMQSFFPDAYSKIETAEVASGETRVMDGMFADCAALRGGATQTDMSMIPDSVTNIGARAFQNCTALTAFVVPDSVVQMGVSVFRNCTNLWNVTLSRNLAAIPDYAFYGCTMLETMIVPASVTYLGSQFFSGRTDPDSGIDIENALYYLCTNAPSYHSSAYAAISGNMTTYVLQNSRSWDGRQGSRVLPQTWNGHAITYWTPNSFDVTFDANGGQFGASGGSTWNERQITDTTYALPSTEPTRPGWVFEGWWTEETGGAEVRYSTTVTATRTHTLYAHWRSLGESMTVTFNSNGGTTVVPGTQDYVPGQTFGQFPVPTRRGYLFVGWYLTARMDGEIVSAETVVSSNVTWYAQWIKDPLGTYSTGQDAIQPTPYSGTEATWTVQFETRGGTLDAKYRSMAVPRGAKFGLLPVPTRAGYAFAGWCTSPADAGLVTEATQVPAADMELFAHWMPITYYVRFNANGGLGGMECQAFLFDGQQSLKTHTFTHSQSAFAGWATTPSGQVRYAENASVVNLEEVHGRIVDLYAVWMGAGYSVRFDANGGTGYMDNQTIALGETRNLWPCAFTWAGYAFAGWALSPTAASAGNVAYRDGQAVKNLATANGATVPLYAVWVAAAQTARITFDANGGSVAPDYWNCVVGTAVEAFPTPTRPGFTFAGWWTAKTGGTQVESIARVTSAQTFYAHWAENGSVTPGDGTCIVTFNPNGGSVGETTRQMAEGSSLVMLPTPTRTGFTFAGWWTAANGGVQVSAATIVTGSVTYYAHWNHLVAFDANGGSLGTASPTRLVAEGDAVGTLPVPERADYLFAGWWTAVSNGTQIAATTVVPSNMTYYALWNCTVTFNANGGSLDTASSSRLVMENTEIGELPGAVRTGYAFAGWWTAASGGAQISASTVVTAAVTNYAHWTANTYFVSFSATGGMGTYNQQMVYDEAAALLPNRFDKAGSLFRGWATTLGGAVVYGDGAIVRNLSARANDVVTLYAVWQEKPASVLACEEAFAGTAEVALDADDNIVVTLTNDVSGTVEIPDNVGGIAIDLNGHDMIGNGGLGETALPDGPAIRIVSGDGDGEATSLAIVDTSDGEKGQIAGGGESAGIEIAEDAASRVWLDVDDGIAVLNGDGSEQDWKELLSVEATLTVGKYFTATLTELGYDVPTDGTAYEVKAYGLPAGLKLVSNKAVTKKVGKKTVVVTPAKSEWWIEGVPTAAMDYFTNPPYLVITVGGVAEVHALPIEVQAQEVTDLNNESLWGEMSLGQSLTADEPFYLPGVGAGWSVSGLPTGLKYTAKLLTEKWKSGNKTMTVTKALPYSVYGKTTKAGLFTITAKKKVGAYYETMKYRVLVKPGTVDTAIFGDGLTNITTMAYVPVDWDLTGENGRDGSPSRPQSEVNGSQSNVDGGRLGEAALPVVPTVAKVTGLPAGVTFVAKDTYAYTNAKKKTGKYLKQKGQAIVGTPTKPGTYVVTFTKNVKSGKKTVAKTAQVLWKVVANDAEVELGFNKKGGVVESGVVGLKYGDLMAFSATSNATVTASGLPAGIKLVRLDDKSDEYGGRLGEAALPGEATYVFTGFTTKAGTYLVTVTATLNGKTLTQRVALKVDALPAWAKGTYNGCVWGTGNGEWGTGGSRPVATNGLATVTVSAVGKISGKFSENGTNWAISAACYTAAGTRDACPYQFVCSNVVAKYSWKVKSGKKTETKTLTREFTLNVDERRVTDNEPVQNETGETRGFVTLTETDATGRVPPEVTETGGSRPVATEIEAWQNLWGATYKAVGKKLFTTKSGKKTLNYNVFAYEVYTNETGRVYFKDQDGNMWDADGGRLGEAALPGDGDKTGLTYFINLSLKVTTAGAVTATVTYDTGKTTKDKKTKKMVPVYYKPTCTTVVIPTSAADADTFTGFAPLYFAPSAANNFSGFAAAAPF